MASKGRHPAGRADVPRQCLGRSASLAADGGAKMVMPGGKMDGEAIYELLDTEKVSATAAVPTVWLMLLQYLEQTRT
jgi:acyl-CoA synthetase (AMP-forming)/AMP-acid ligase II